MDWPSENDFNLLSEENSDFDVLLSPASVKSDEDEEVFVGPVGHMEKCIATGIDLNCKEEKSVESTETLKWSPLNTDKFVEVFREASLLARRYENHAEEKTKEMGGKIMQNKLVEQFIEESKLNLSLLKDITNSCSPRKMTSIIRSTPLKLHLPGIWNKPEDNSQDCLGIPLKSLKKAAVQATSCSMQSQQNSGDSSSLNNKEIAACSETTNFGEAPIDQPPICEPTQPMTSEKLCPHKPPESKASSSMRKSGAGSAGRPLNCISSSTSSLRTSPSVGRLLSQNMPLNTSKLKAPKNSRIAVPKSKISNSTCVTNAPNTKLMKPANISKLSTPGKVNLQGPGMQTVSNKGLQTIGSTTSKKVDIPVKSIKAGNVPGQDQRSKAKPFLQASQKSNVPSPGNTRSKTTDLKKQSACSAFESKRKPSEKPKVLCSPNSSGDEIFPPLVPCILDFSPDKPQTTCQEKAKEHASETLIKENLLFEINTKNRLIEDRPLIDLSNTPDQKRIAPLKDLEPLIDFSSPLILLSPADKENVDVNSPLLKF
ncbi:G2 and S phase-expressed protein 1 isoform X5 [Pristis pectinata]|uniref:G2 and S phase-expressed protein 1 isoform X5 n=1 Tax=Pristis pectinata TaxID=685728 RepID=UPI00223DB563|nr:G2 and S phase-expressed protein 1 isoform X5 [Pristis pectinata]